MAMTLKAARTNAGFEQEEAAKKLHVTVRTLRNWEAGASFPNVLQLKRIESTYGVSYNDLSFCLDATRKE